jgi:hypothetical protein
MEPHDAPPAEGALHDAFAVQFAAVGERPRPAVLPHGRRARARPPLALAERRRRSPSASHADSTASETLAGSAAVRARRRSRTGSGSSCCAVRWPRPRTGERPAFRAGEPVPIAFYAWDGSNGETGKRAAIGSWYFLFLEQPATARVYIVPLARHAHHRAARPRRRARGPTRAGAARRHCADPGVGPTLEPFLHVHPNRSLTCGTHA